MKCVPIHDQLCYHLASYFDLTGSFDENDVRPNFSPNLHSIPDIKGQGSYKGFSAKYLGDGDIVSQGMKIRREKR